MRLLIGFVLLSASLFAQATDCAAQSGPPVVQCGVQYSTRALNLPGEPALQYNSYVPSSSPNAYPIVIWMMGCGWRTVAICQQGGNAGLGNNFFLNLAKFGWCPSQAAPAPCTNGGWATGPLNVYMPWVSMTLSAQFTASAGAGATSLTVTPNSGFYWPASTWSGSLLIAELDNSLSEMVTLSSQTGSSAPFTLTLASGTAHAHTATALVAGVAAEFPRPQQDLAEFIAFLGHNAPSAAISGNPANTYFFADSSGTTNAMLFNQLGCGVFFNASNSDFALADCQKVKIVLVGAVSPPADIGCWAVGNSNGTQPLGIMSFKGVVPTATSIGETNATACNPTGENAAYDTITGLSPVKCLPGSASCGWGTPLLQPAPTAIINGNADTTVTQWPGREWFNLAPGFINNGWLLNSTAGQNSHTVDLYTPGNGFNITYPPNPGPSFLLNAMFPVPTLGGVRAIGSNGMF